MKVCEFRSPAVVLTLWKVVTSGVIPLLLMTVTTEVPTDGYVRALQRGLLLMELWFLASV